MYLTPVSKEILRVRRGRRDLERRGFEEVGERGGRLWELHRGGRYDSRIVAVEIDPGGKSLWVQIQPR